MDVPPRQDHKLCIHGNWGLAHTNIFNSLGNMEFLRILMTIGTVVFHMAPSLARDDVMSNIICFRVSQSSGSREIRDYTSRERIVC